MSEVYDTGLWNNVLLAAKKEGMDLACGTYLMYSGPSYEPPAEIRFFDKIGADAVGMSTVLEAIIARHCDIQSFPGEGICLLYTSWREYGAGRPDQLVLVDSP